MSNSFNLDRFVLDRFVAAQAEVYHTALAEIRNGAKRSHWMWFIFPQLAGLGHSATAKYYAIGSRAEARAYLKHPVLGARLRECLTALQNCRKLRPNGFLARSMRGSCVLA